MLNKIIAFALKNKLIIGLFIIALIGYGTYQLGRLPIDAVPDITNNQVQVITIAPSYGATDIERLVTFPIEQANSSISGIKEIRSFSRFGLSLVTIVFDDATNVYWARQQVSERLQKIKDQIPKGIGQPELGPITTGLGEIYQYVLRPKKGYESKYDETALRTIQDWVVRRQLLGVKGVAEVSSFGGKLKQYSIEITPSKLNAYNVSIDDVFAALENNNQNTGGAYIEKGASVLYIRTEGLINSISDIEHIAIKTTAAGTPLYIGDVATVKIGYATRYGALCYNDQGEVAGAIVMMLKGANTSEVITAVKERIAMIQKTLPEGVVLEPFLDRTKMVNNAISTVKQNLLEGALIVIFVLVLFLGNWRAGLLVASVIPLAMLFAIIMMNLFGVSGNLMSLGALDFGLIVDGAVIIVEAVMHLLVNNKDFRQKEKLNQTEMDFTVQQSAGKMMNSAVFGQVIILVVYLPIFTLQGIEGKMFKPMAQTVAFALLGAFLLSLTYIPMMSALFLSKKTYHRPNWSDRMMQQVSSVYQHALKRVLQFPKIVLGATASLFVIALYVLSTLGGEFIPTLEEGDFAIDVRVLTGSSLSTSIEHTQKAAHILLTQFPEVLKVVTKTGSGEVPTDPMPMEASDMMVILKDKKEWTSAHSFNELSEKMGKALEVLPGITFGFQYPVQMRFNELMTGARQDVVCKIYGEDLDTLAAYAAHLGQIVNSVKGAKNLYVESIAGLAQIIVRYNRSAIAQYGLNIAEVNRIVNTSLAGQSAGLVFEGEKKFDMVLRISREDKSDLADIENILVPTPSGMQVPLAQLASIGIEEGPNQIQREDAKRRIIVGFNTRGRDVQSIVAELQQKVDKTIKFPTGYYVTYGGAFENLNAAKSRLMIAVPISLLLILILLFFAFKSLKHGLLIYSAIPLSAIGGIFFLALRGLPFSISAGVGFIALFGVAVLNGIVLVAEFNRIKNAGESDLHQVVLKGALLRLRPVLMTAFVASLGFLPMALSNGSGAEVQRPLATVVIGGLLIATLLTLFVLPVLYLIFEKKVFKLPNMKTKAPLLLLILISFGTSQVVSAQASISLDAAIDTAIKNNLLLKNEALKLSYQKALQHSGSNIPATNISSEAGQFNSIYTDTKWSIGQSFSLPMLYVRQHQLLQQEVQNSFLNVALAHAELRKQVALSFYKLIYLQEKRKLMEATDSLYEAFEKRATLRLQAGASNVLEQASAQNQRGQISIQMAQLTTDLHIAQLQFQLLLNTEEPYQPLANSFKMQASAIPASTSILEHPYLKKIEQQKKIAQADIRLQRAQLWPQISLAANNSSIRGMGADDKVYTAGYRFISFQAGLSIPLLGGSQRAKLSAAKVNSKLMENNFEAQKQLLDQQYQFVRLHCKQYQETVDYIEQHQLKNASLIRNIAEEQLYNGEINYLEWVMLINQSISTRNDYIEAVNSLNQATIELHYFTTK